MPIRAPIANLHAGERALDAELSRYLCRVLRLGMGDHFVAFDTVARTEADATILIASTARAVVRIDDLRPAAVLAQAPLVLVYALAKGDKVDAVIRDATELGATQVIVAKTSRSIVKTDDARAEAKIQRWQRIAEQAARQCGRADPPAVTGILPWSEALAAANADVRYCLHVGAADSLGASLPIHAAKALAFAIGPEGGLSEDEVEVARAAGYAVVSLGRFVLRTETVAAAVLGAVRVLGASDASSNDRA